MAPDMDPLRSWIGRGETLATRARPYRPGRCRPRPDSGATDPKKARAKVGRCFRRPHARGLIAEVPRTRRRRVSDDGRKVIGTTMCSREQDVPNVYAGVMH
jgi:hypothetical protein